MTTMEKKSQLTSLNKLGILFIILALALLLTILLINSDNNRVGLYEILLYIVIGLLVFTGFSTSFLGNQPFIKKIDDRFHHFIQHMIGPMILLTTLIFTFLGLEIVARLIINNNPSFRLHRLNAQPSFVTETPAYQGADFAHAAFFDERFDPINVFLVKDDANDLVMPQDYQGNYINVINNLRNTIGQPPNANHTVYLFGGSTVFNIEVPDQHTVASNLQALLNQEFPDTYKVENLGVLGVTSGEQLKRLYTLDIEAGDVIIFFDGINDIIRNLQYQGNGFLKTLDKSYLYKYFLKAYIERWIPKYELPNQLEIQNEYHNNIMTAASFVSANDAQFFHFLQPNIYFIRQPSSYEKDIISSLEKDYPGWEVGITYGYGGLVEANKQLENSGIATADLRYILSHENRSYDHEIFFDDVHVNHIGNQIIAEAIFEYVKDQLPEE